MATCSHGGLCFASAGGLLPPRPLPVSSLCICRRSGFGANSNSNSIQFGRKRHRLVLQCNAAESSDENTVIAKHLDVDVVEEGTQAATRELFQKIKQAEIDKQDEYDELERKKRIQDEREYVLAASWKRSFLKFVGKLKGTVWDPEPSHKITFSEFSKLLDKKQVRFLEYKNLGESVAVILPYYKDGKPAPTKPKELANDTKREVVFRRHFVRKMPVDCWTDVWKKLHEQLVNIEVVDTSSVRYAWYTSSSLLVLWALRAAVIALLFLWSRRFIRKQKPSKRIYFRPRIWFAPQIKKLFEVFESFNTTGFFNLPRTKFLSAEERTGVTFDDFAGQEYVKYEVQEIVKLLTQSQEYANLGVYCPRGLLLHGPPGTGKTLLARAIAGEAGVPFFAANGSSFVEMFVGVAASRVKNLFERARSVSPSIIFIDEIDAIGAKRGGVDVGGGGMERELALLQMLVELDGYRTTNERVLVIGATNRLDILDPALLRKGRFDKILKLGLPSEEGRLEILRVHARNKAFRSQEEKEALLKEVAKDSEDYSGAELENILNEAAILCQRNDKAYIEREDLMESMKRQEGAFATGLEEYREIPLELKIRLAYREAAIAVLECYYPIPYRPFLKTDILSVGKKPNMEYDKIRHNYFARKSDYVNLIIRACASRAIEEEMFGKENLSVVSGLPLAEAGLYAEYLIARTGMTALGQVYYKKESDVMLHIGPKLQALRDEYVRYAVEKCTSILRECRSAVQTIADILLEKNEISAGEIWDVFNNASRTPQPRVRPIDEYGALVNVGRWGIHGITLPGRATFSPGNVGFATYGAPCPQQTQVISDETWRVIDAMQERSLREFRENIGQIKEISEVLTKEHFL